MKENILDVLMYLFENYIDEDVDINANTESLKTELAQAGFRRGQINRAFEWLESLTAQQQDSDSRVVVNNRPSMRVFNPREKEKLDLECQGFMIFLEQVGVLDPASRELVIDRVMALESDEIDLEQLKWVVLMVLFNQPGYEAAFAWIEDMVFDEGSYQLH